MEDKNHFICIGGCGGNSDEPGLCKAISCDNYNHELVECNCDDGEHAEVKGEIEDTEQ